MSRISFVVPAVPVAQPRPKARVVNGHAQFYGAKKDHAVHSFKATVRLAASNAHAGAPLEGPLYVSIRFVLPRAQHQIWKTKPMPRLWHTKKPDKDNLEKSVLDALTGLLWVDDSQVCSSRVAKVTAHGDEQPHVEIKVRKLDPECPCRKQGGMFR